MSAVKKAPVQSHWSKNRNHVATLSMLNSRHMANSRPTVLVTELEYRKAEASFAVGAGAGVPARARRRSRARVGDTRGARVVRDRRVAHLLRTALRGAAGWRRDRTIRRRPRRHRQGEGHCGRSPLHQHAGRPQSVGGRTHDAARRRRGAATRRHVDEHGATAVGAGDGRGAAGQDTGDHRLRRHRARRRAHRLARVRHAGRRLFPAGRAAAGRHWSTLAR